MSSLPLVAVQELNEEFDAFVIVANNLQADLEKTSLLGQFGDLELLKNVKINTNFHERKIKQT